MGAPKAEKGEEIVRGQAVKFIHKDIHSRYRIENIRALGGPDIDRLLAGIGQEEIDALEELFRCVIYPEVDARHERDKSFESMIAMLKNPGRLTHIVPSLPLLVLRYASIWPSALNTGISAMLSYINSVHVENSLVRETLALLEEDSVVITPGYILTEDLYREAYRRVPMAEGRKMINYAVKTFGAGRNDRLIAATYNILDDVQKTFIHLDSLRIEAEQPPIYTDPISAMNFGKETLKNIRRVFSLYPPDKMDRMIKITRIVEYAYLDRIHGVENSAPHK